MDIGSFQSEFVHMGCVKCAFLLVLLQPLVAIPLGGIIYDRPPLPAVPQTVQVRKAPAPIHKIIHKGQPLNEIPLHDFSMYDKQFTYQDNKKKLSLTADFKITVYARQEGTIIRRKEIGVDDVVRMTGTSSKSSAIVKLELPPADAFFKITFDPFKPSLATSKQQLIIPEIMFRADTMFPDLDGAKGFASFKGPVGTVDDYLFEQSINPVPSKDNKQSDSKYEYFATLTMDTLRLESSPIRSLKASDDKQSVGGSVGVAIGVVLAVVAVVAVAAAVGLVVRRRVKASMATSEKASLVTLTLS